MEILVPALPLLQATVDMSTKLGFAVFELYNPDSEISLFDALVGNLRYLFSPDPRIRDEALLRLIYISSSYGQSDFYLPNLEHIKDTLTNNICVVSTPLPLRSGVQRGTYSSATLTELMGLLKNTNATPSVRHSTIVQISALLEDPDLCDAMYHANEWPFIMQAFYNSLNAFYHQDYPDTAIPTLQIVTKLCLRVAEYRRNVAGDSEFMFLLVRAMFLHHHNQDFKRDCATLVFLLVYSDFVVGMDELSYPNALAALKIPFQCSFHFATSPFDEITVLESVLAADQEQPYNDLVIMIDDDDDDNDDFYSENRQ